MKKYKVGGGAGGGRGGRTKYTIFERVEGGGFEIGLKKYQVLFE